MLLSLDISTSCIGIAVFDNKHKLQELSHIKLKSKEGLFKKLDEFIDHFQKYGQIKFTGIAIEEPLKKFKGRFSSADTIQKLTQMNSLISGYLYLSLGIQPAYYNVSSARKTAFPSLVIPKDHPNKKYLIWDAVMNMEPTINWIYSKTGKLADENFDMCDAYVVGAAYIVEQIGAKNGVSAHVEKQS
jgi:hypothetical protein